MPAARRAVRQRNYFPVARGLIEPEHHRQIGPSIWVYLWVLCHQTGNTGEVAKREVVTLAQIGEDVEMDTETVRRHVERLENSGYLTVESVPGEGMRVWVNKPLLVAPETAPGPASKSRRVEKGPASESRRVEGGPASEMRRVSIEGTESFQENRVLDSVARAENPDPQPWRAAVVSKLRSLPSTIREVLVPGHESRLDYALGMAMHDPGFHRVDPARFVEAVLSILDGTVFATPQIPAPSDVNEFGRALRTRLQEATP